MHMPVRPVCAYESVSNADASAILYPHARTVEQKLHKSLPPPPPCFFELDQKKRNHVRNRIRYTGTVSTVRYTGMLVRKEIKRGHSRKSPSDSYPGTEATKPFPPFSPSCLFQLDAQKRTEVCTIYDTTIDITTVYVCTNVSQTQTLRRACTLKLVPIPRTEATSRSLLLLDTYFYPGPLYFSRASTRLVNNEHKPLLPLRPCHPISLCFPS